jgi:DUF4097 and DUF4098 domain-containing protein YvlB
MRLPLVLLALAVLATGCDVRVGERGISVDLAEGKARDEWIRTYTIAPGGTLEIVNVNGAIELTGTTGSQVEVHAEREAREHSTEAAAEMLRRVEMREEVSAGRVRIEAQVPREEGFLRHRAPVTVVYRVRVPASVVSLVRTENGGIRLDNLAGEVTASTTNGGVNGQGLSGKVDAETTNGGVQLDFADVRADVRVATTNGGVRLQLPADVKAAVEASCVNGGIDVDDGFGLQISESSNRRLRAALNGGGPRIAASTVNGGVRIRTRAAIGTD